MSNDIPWFLVAPVPLAVPIVAAQLPISWAWWVLLMLAYAGALAVVVYRTTELALPSLPSLQEVRYRWSARPSSRETG